MPVPAMSFLSSLELASFFAQLRAAIGVSLYRPSFCCFRVWLRFLLFLFRVRVSRPRLKSGLPRSAELPSVIVPTLRCIPIFRQIPPIRRGDGIAHNRCDRFFASSFILQPPSFRSRSDCAMTSPRRRPQRASPSCFRIRVFKEPQRPEATLAQFKYATSPGRSCRPGRLESGFFAIRRRSHRIAVHGWLSSSAVLFHVVCVPSATQVEPRRPVRPGRDHTPAGGREGVGDDEPEPSMRCMSFGGLLPAVLPKGHAARGPSQQGLTKSCLRIRWASVRSLYFSRILQGLGAGH